MVAVEVSSPQKIRHFYRVLTVLYRLVPDEKNPANEIPMYEISFMDDIQPLLLPASEWRVFVEEVFDRDLVSV